MITLIKYDQYEEALYYIKEKNPYKTIKTLDFEINFEEVFQTLTNKGFFDNDFILILKNLKTLNNNKFKNYDLFNTIISNYEEPIFLVHDFCINNKTNVLNNKLFNSVDLTITEQKLDILYSKYKDIPNKQIINTVFKQLDNNFIFFINEIEKIKNLNFEDLTLEIIISNINDSVEYNVFILLEYILLGQKKKAILLFNTLTSNRIDEISILSIMETQIKFIHQLKILTPNYGVREISTLLNINEFRVKKNMKLVTSSPEDMITKTYKKIALLDYQVKMGIVIKNSILIKILST